MILELIWEFVVGYSIFYVLILRVWYDVGSILSSYIYNLDRSAEVVGGDRFIGKFV